MKISPQPANKPPVGPVASTEIAGGIPAEVKLNMATITLTENNLDLAVLGLQLDSMTLKVFSNLNDSMTFRSAAQLQQVKITRYSTLVFP